MSAFNALMLGLHADSRGFSTAHYTSFTDANRRGESVLQGEKGEKVEYASLRNRAARLLSRPTGWESTATCHTSCRS
jgi:antirestriction protein ArdC